MFSLLLKLIGSEADLQSSSLVDYVTVYSAKAVQPDLVPVGDCDSI